MGHMGAAPARGGQGKQGVKVVVWEGVTTLMVRNIPVRYTQDMLLAEWPNDEVCRHDFLYLPIAIDRKRNVSFAFVNFVSTAGALAFYSRWQRRRLQHYNTQKPLDISPADVQGRDANLLQVVRHKTFRIRNSHFLPAIFDGKTGLRIHIDDLRDSLDLGSKEAEGQRANVSAAIAAAAERVIGAAGSEGAGLPPQMAPPIYPPQNAMMPPPGPYGAHGAEQDAFP